MKSLATAFAVSTTVLVAALPAQAPRGGARTALFDLRNDPYELHNLYGEAGQEPLTAALKAELARLKREVRDDDQLSDRQLPNGVDGPVARLRGK